jgi:hypothetical protein
MAMQTQFGSLSHYEKGGVKVINDNPKHYCFSNCFEVATKSRPYERIALGKHLKYVIEAARAEGASPWYAADHDESVLIMDGDVEIYFIKPDQSQVRAGKEGAVKLAAEPKGKKMGWVKAGQGHMALLPAGSAYQFRSAQPGVMLIQTMQGDCTVERWAEVCQTN